MQEINMALFSKDSEALRSFADKAEFQVLSLIPNQICYIPGGVLLMEWTQGADRAYGIKMVAPSASTSNRDAVSSMQIRSSQTPKDSTLSFFSDMAKHGWKNE